MLGGAAWMPLRRKLAVAEDGAYTKATTYNTKDGDVFVPNEINAYGKPGTTLYFSTLLLSPLSDDEGRWISFERGDYKGNKNDNEDGYDGNDRIVVGVERGRDNNSIGLRYITKDAENVSNFDVTYAYPQGGYTIHDKKETQLIVVKFEFNEDETTDVSLYLNPGSEEPESADATLTATTDVSFDRIQMDINGAFETAMDEIKLSTSWESAVSAVEGEISAEVKPATQSDKDVLMVEETFDSYEKGQFIKPISDEANQVAGGGFGWKNAEDKSKDSQNFTWSSTQNNDSSWAKTLIVDDTNPITYPNLVTSDKYITYTGYDTGNGIETIGFGRMIDFSDDSLVVQNGYVNNDTNGTKYINGNPGGTVWMSALMRMQTKDVNEGNTVTFDRGRWGFPWQTDGPGLSVGVRRWSGDNKNYWNVAFGDNKVQTEKEIVAGESTLVVAKVEANEALAGTISVWINPDLKTLGEPDAKINVRNQPVMFRQVTITNRDFDLGAIRIGTTFRSVTPLQNDEEEPTESPENTDKPDLPPVEPTESASATAEPTATEEAPDLPPEEPTEKPTVNNMLINGDFSQGKEGWSFPDSATIISEDGIDGDYLKVVEKAWANDVTQRLYDVPAGNYRLTFDFKGWYMIAFGPGDWGTEAIGNKPGSSDAWKNEEILFTVPENDADYYTLRMMADQRDNTVCCFDNIVLERLPEVEPTDSPAESPTPEVEKVNVVYKDIANNTVATVQVVKGETIGKLPTMFRDGYNFDGWLLNGELITADLIVEEDITLKVKFTRDSSKTPACKLRLGANVEYVKINGYNYEPEMEDSLEVETRVVLKMKDVEDMEVDYWSINGVAVSTEQELSFLVQPGEMSVDVVLKSEGSEGMANIAPNSMITQIVPRPDHKGRFYVYAMRVIDDPSRVFKCGIVIKPVNSEDNVKDIEIGGSGVINMESSRQNTMGEYAIVKKAEETVYCVRSYMIYDDNQIVYSAPQTITVPAEQ